MISRTPTRRRVPSRTFNRLSTMWCATCQQDVPGVSADCGQVRCARCQQLLPIAEADQPARQRTQQDDLELADSFCRIGWQVEDDLQSAELLLRRIGRTRATQRTGAEPARVYRMDAAHKERSRRGPHRRPLGTPRRAWLAGFVGWTLLALGLMSSVFGGFLLAWSFWHHRADLWQLGLPCTLVGQAALVLGLVFQLESLWRSNRATHVTLAELDQQLDELRHTTSLLASSHSSPSQSFYAHMAEGASPHLLLADLKGQLDLLSTRLSERT